MADEYVHNIAAPSHGDSGNNSFFDNDNIFRGYATRGDRTYRFFGTAPSLGQMEFEFNGQSFTSPVDSNGNFSIYRDFVGYSGSLMRCRAIYGSGNSTSWINIHLPVVTMLQVVEDNDPIFTVSASESWAPTGTLSTYEWLSVGVIRNQNSVTTVLDFTAQQENADEDFVGGVVALAGDEYPNILGTDDYRFIGFLISVNRQFGLLLDRFGGETTAGNVANGVQIYYTIGTVAQRENRATIADLKNPTLYAHGNLVALLAQDKASKAWTVRYSRDWGKTWAEVRDVWDSNYVNAVADSTFLGVEVTAAIEKATKKLVYKYATGAPETGGWSAVKEIATLAAIVPLGIRARNETRNSGIVIYASPDLKWQSAGATNEFVAA